MHNDLALSILRHPQRFFLLLLYKVRILTKPRQVRLKTTFGKSMVVVLPEIVSSLLYLTGRYERDVEDVFRKYIKEGDVVVDIGAHFGYFSLLASTLVSKDGKVYSFEPTPSTYQILKRNTQGLKNVHIVNQAVYDKRSTLALHDYGLQYGALNSFFEPRIGKKLEYKSFNVASITLDLYFSKLKRQPDFIKIDAESSEFFILKGMSKILLKKKPIICMELGDMDIAGIKTSKELIAFLKRKKYTAHFYQDKVLSKYRAQVFHNKHVNLLFMPNK